MRPLPILFLRRLVRGKACVLCEKPLAKGELAVGTLLEYRAGRARICIGLTYMHLECYEEERRRQPRLPSLSELRLLGDQEVSKLLKKVLRIKDCEKLERTGLDALLSDEQGL